MVMLYPSCILISYIGPSQWLPTAEVRRLTFTWPAAVLTWILGALGYLHMLSVNFQECESGKVTVDRLNKELSTALKQV